MASAKQKAWRKKFAAMAKSGKFRKTNATGVFFMTVDGDDFYFWIC